MTAPKHQDRRTFKRTPRKPAPKRKAWDVNERWTVQCRNGWDLVPSFDGNDQTIHDVVRLLNHWASAGRRTKKGERR